MRKLMLGVACGHVWVPVGVKEPVGRDWASTHLSASRAPGTTLMQQRNVLLTPRRKTFRTLPSTLRDFHVSRTEKNRG